MLKKDPLYQNQAARVFWAAEAGMRHHFEKGAASSGNNGQDYTRFKMSVSGPDNKAFRPRPLMIRKPLRLVKRTRKP